jgi:hypothetical protein
MVREGPPVATVGSSGTSISIGSMDELEFWRNGVERAHPSLEDLTTTTSTSGVCELRRKE